MSPDSDTYEKRRALNHAPKSLNSDISWFGVGGKQAVFFIGSSARVSLDNRPATLTRMMVSIMFTSV